MQKHWIFVIGSCAGLFAVLVAAFTTPGLRHSHAGGGAAHTHSHAHGHIHSHSHGQMHSHSTVADQRFSQPSHVHLSVLGLSFTLPDFGGNESSTRVSTVQLTPVSPLVHVVLLTCFLMIITSSRDSLTTVPHLWSASLFDDRCVGRPAEAPPRPPPEQARVR